MSRVFAWCFFLCLWAALPALQAQPAGKKLVVGLHEKPPFTIQEEDGGWGGLAVDLWEEVAEKLGYSYEYRVLPYEQLIPALERRELDLAIGELAVDPQVEERIDFSQPYLASSLGVAVSTRRWEPDWIGIFKDFFNWGLVKILLGIMAGLFLASFLIWAVERRHAHTHFGGKGWHGFGSALWFSAVTMTSVGYGDKTPNTFVGRLIAFLWMLAGVLIIAAFTGSVASSVATARIKDAVISPSDINRLNAGVLAGSRADAILRQLGIRHTTYEFPDTALSELATGRLDALVADRITLGYLIQHDQLNRVRLLPMRFNDYGVAMAFPPNSPIREDVNVALLEVINTAEWRERLHYWLGQDVYPNIQ